MHDSCHSHFSTCTSCTSCTQTVTGSGTFQTFPRPGTKIPRRGINKTWRFLGISPHKMAVAVAVVPWPLLINVLFIIIPRFAHHTFRAGVRAPLPGGPFRDCYAVLPDTIIPYEGKLRQRSYGLSAAVRIRASRRRNRNIYEKNIVIRHEK